MPIFLPALASLAGSTIVRYTIAGVVTYVAGTEVIGYFDATVDESIEEYEQQMLDAGGTIISESLEALGNVSLAFIRGAIPALIDGITAGYDAIREGFRGKEPETIAALTIGILVAVAVLTLLHEVKTGPGGAGEYQAGNRPPYE